MEFNKHLSLQFAITLIQILLSSYSNARSQEFRNSHTPFIDLSNSQVKVFRVKEETSNGTVIPGVGKYLLQFGLIPSLNPSYSKSTHNFQLLSSQTALINALHLDPTSGELTVINRIDREVLCPSAPSGSRTLDQHVNMRLLYETDALSSSACLKTLEVLVTSKSAELPADVRKLAFILQIDDINDNSPQWPFTHLHGKKYEIRNGIGDDNLPVLEVRLLETAKNSDNFATPTAKAVLPLAHDPDAGLNAIVNYRLEPYSHRSSNSDEFIQSSSPPFILKQTSEDLLELVATESLDYEKNNVYQLRLVAYDSGSPSLSSTALLRINLIDVNDEPPIFTKDIFYPPAGSISEKTAPGTVILNLSATDADASPVNNRIRYIMVSNPIASKYFTVQADGRVILQQWLDYESMDMAKMDASLGLDPHRTIGTRKWFIFQVQAIDSAPAPYEKKGQATVVIPVRDENDEDPVITVKFFGSADVTNNGRLGAVTENSTPPVRVAYIQVKDPDFDGQDRVTCQISDTTNFSLTAMQSVQSTGTETDYLLSLLVPVDREQTPIVQVLLKCSDDASNSNEQTLRIRVLDVNDEGPRFTQTIYQFHLLENSEPHSTLTFGDSSSSSLFGYRVGRVLAHDKDMGANAHVTYRLDPSSLQIVPSHPRIPMIPTFPRGQHGFYFDRSVNRKPELADLYQIDEETGVIYALKSFDAENIEQFKLTVLAIDRPVEPGANALTGRASVEIKIVDTNDCAPVFYQEDSQLTNHTGNVMENVDIVNQYVFHVKENRPAYWMVGRVMALDPDISSADSKLSWNSGNETVYTMNVKLHISPMSDVDVRKTFSLHSTSGQLRTIIPLDREKKAVYMFTVVATDGVEGKTTIERSSTATVTVFVDDENDSDPVFIRPMASSDKTPKPKAISTPQHSSSGRDASTVEPSANAVVEKDDNKVSDHTIPVVLVHRKTWIQHVNKDGEFVGGGVPLLQLEATDADAGDNGRLTYRIGSGNSDGLFILNNVTGTLMFAPAARSTRERTNSAHSKPESNEGKHINYLLRFEACDNGVPKRCALPIWIRMVLDLRDLKELLPGEQLTGEITNGVYVTDPQEEGGNLLQYFDGQNSATDLLSQHTYQFTNWETANRVGPTGLQNWHPYNKPGNLGPGGSFVGRQKPAWNVEKLGNTWSANRGIDRAGYTVEGLLQHYGPNHQPPGLIASEVVIICLVIIFIVLLSAASILFCLLKKKFLLFALANKRKFKTTHKNGPPHNGDSKHAQLSGFPADQPMEVTNSTSLYRPPSSANKGIPEVSDLFPPLCSSPNMINSETNVADAISLQSFARRNSEPSLEANSQNFTPLYQSTALYSPHVGNLMNRTQDHSDAWYHNAEATPLRTKRVIPRSYTPCLEVLHSPSFPMHTSMCSSNCMQSHSFHKSPPLIYHTASPLPVSHNNVTKDIWHETQARPSYLCVSPTMDRAIHFRGDSLPVYPENKIIPINSPMNWPQFEHPVDHSHTYQELSALTSSLHRHPIPANWRTFRTLENRPSAHNLVNMQNYSLSPRKCYTDERNATRHLSTSPKFHECEEQVALLRDPSGLTSVEELMENSETRGPLFSVQLGENASCVESDNVQSNPHLVNQLTESSSTSGIVSDQIPKSPTAKYVYDAYREASFV